MLKIIQKINSRHLNNSFIKKYAIVSYSTKPVTKEDDKIEENPVIDFTKNFDLTPRIRQKKPQKPPFVKNLLLGKFDTDILAYPELEKEDWQDIEKNCDDVESALESLDVKDSVKWNDEIGKFLGNNRLLGMQMPKILDGRELNNMECCRLTELVTDLKLRYSILFSDKLGALILEKYGDNRLKVKYLTSLLKGQQLSTLCIVEALETNEDVLKNTAILSADGKHWIINGEAKFVPNGNSAGLIFFSAQTNAIVTDETKQLEMSLFVVDRNSLGITANTINSIDPNIEVAHIHFDNVQVPKENLIGSLGNAANMLQSIYTNYRLSSGVLCTNINKSLINKSIEHTISISKQPCLLYETEMVREKVAAMLLNCYAIESVTYLTSGLMDTYENQDCELETLITKVFSVEKTFENTTICLNLVGNEGISEDHWSSQYHREAISLMNLHETNSDLKLILALFAIQYAGKHTNEIIKKLRNPMMNPLFILKRMWTESRQQEDNPKLNLYLYQSLHPSLQTAASLLEYCVLRLQYATETLLKRHGPEVINQHIELRRIGESLTDIYAMVAAIGRASRSYCIGLPNAEQEVIMATAFSINTKEKVRAKLNKIIDGPVLTSDENMLLVAKRAYELKRYVPVHPLTRNF